MKPQSKQFTDHVCDDKFRMLRIAYDVIPGEPDVNLGNSIYIKEIWLEVERGWRNVTRFVKNRKDMITHLEDLHL